MRCVRCGGRSKRLRIGRGPDGRLLFDWCDDCLIEVHSQALNGGLLAIDYDPPPQRIRTESEIRAVGLRTMGLILSVWGLILEALGAATWLGLGPTENRFGPTRLSRLYLFCSAGAILAVAGAWLGLISVDRPERHRSMAGAIETVALGLGLCVLILGILFHNPKRDPWIVAIVAVACVAIWAARHWSRPRGTKTDRVVS